MDRKKFLLKNIDRLKKWVDKTAKNANGLLVPVSGGTDSALTLWLLMQVYPEKTRAVFVGEKLRAEKWFNKVCNDNLFNCCQGNFVSDHPEVERNTLFQKMAADYGFWLVGTRNRTEDVLGTYSLASRVATYLPIVGVWKSDVIEMCCLIGVPQSVIRSSSQADPECGRPKDLARIPFEYIDLFLKVKMGFLKKSALDSLDRDEIQYLEDVYQRNKFRHDLPVRGPKICNK